MDTAVQVVRDAFDPGRWPQLSLRERAAALVRFADTLDRSAGTAA